MLRSLLAEPGILWWTLLQKRRSSYSMDLSNLGLENVMSEGISLDSGSRRDIAML